MYAMNLDVKEVNEIVVETKDLTKVYNSGKVKVVAVDNVNIKVKKGEFVSIVGPSGSGKSTLLNLIGGLLRPTNGKVFINGIDIYSLDDKRLSLIRNKEIGFVFQSFNLINRINVLKNVELQAIIAGIPEDVRRKRAMELLSMLGIADKAYAKPTELSGGQQQRVAIARALINNPSIILADEPTGNLDTKSGKEVFELMRRLVREDNRTILLITHNLELAMNTDRSIFIKDGKVEKEVINR